MVRVCVCVRACVCARAHAWSVCVCMHMMCVCVRTWCVWVCVCVCVCVNAWVHCVFLGEWKWLCLLGALKRLCVFCHLILLSMYGFEIMDGCVFVNKSPTMKAIIRKAAHIVVSSKCIIGCLSAFFVFFFRMPKGSPLICWTSLAPKHRYQELFLFRDFSPFPLAVSLVHHCALCVSAKVYLLGNLEFLYFPLFFLHTWIISRPGDPHIEWVLK